MKVLLIILWVFGLYFIVSLFYTITVIWNELCETTLNEVCGKEMYDKLIKSGYNNKKAKRIIKQNYYANILITALFLFPYNITTDIKKLIYNHKK